MARSTKMEKVGARQPAPLRATSHSLTASPPIEEGSVWLKKVPITLKRIACLVGSGAPHSALISRHRRTPMKICRNVTAIATPIQPRLETSMRATSSARSTLRSEKYRSAAETSIFNVESRIRRISPVLGLRRGCKKRYNSAPWYGFQADLAIAGTDRCCGDLGNAGKEARTEISAPLSDAFQGYDVGSTYIGHRSCGVHRLPRRPPAARRRPRRGRSRQSQRLLRSGAQS